MVVDIVNKILIFILCLSGLNVIRNVFFLIRSIVNKERFVMNQRPLLILAMSIAYILMSIINGVTI
jgi:hypothetical protein